MVSIFLASDPFDGDQLFAVTGQQGQQALFHQSQIIATISIFQHGTLVSTLPS